MDAFLALRGLPEHTELIDGGLVFVSPQEKWRRQVLSLLRRELDLQAPPHLRADREIATSRYVPVGIFHDRLKISAPFPIDIDLSALGRRG
ncbi:hypothetical protein [Nocardia higoensis]|uniref:hypothetical protein n=1 Tax=Nocardia higoensis TaxID=228599 RepID=UPI0002FEE7DB|nr:hypothetical protein [Nocardia higoensis]